METERTQQLLKLRVRHSVSLWLLVVCACRGEGIGDGCPLIHIITERATHIRGLVDVVIGSPIPVYFCLFGVGEEPDECNVLSHESNMAD